MMLKPGAHDAPRYGMTLTVKPQSVLMADRAAAISRFSCDKH